MNGEVERAVNEWLEPAFGPDDLSNIQQPALAIYHRDARFTLFDEVQAELVASIPHVESVEIAVGSDLLQIEEPQAVATALASFLLRHPFTVSDPRPASLNYPALHAEE